MISSSESKLIASVVGGDVAKWLRSVDISTWNDASEAIVCKCDTTFPGFSVSIAKSSVMKDKSSSIVASTLSNIEEVQLSASLISAEEDGLISCDVKYFGD